MKKIGLDEWRLVDFNQVARVVNVIGSDLRRDLDCSYIGMIIIWNGSSACPFVIRVFCLIE